mmetsp:Transcript_15790/g.36555  ORF Transcript_15790/g.36555 Transcript_15790/m.36555 type:complete len:607 (+) Transcript_15790:243-2063(+)
MKHDVQTIVYIWLMLLIATVMGLTAFVPPTRPILSSSYTSSADFRERSRDFRFLPGICLKATGDNEEKSGDDEDEKKTTSAFFFDMSKNNLDPRSSMDSGIYDMLGGEGSSSGTTSSEKADSLKRDTLGNDSIDWSQRNDKKQETVVVVMDWECLLDALPYHIELGIQAARTTWPHLNDLCNFDTDRDWLENKLSAMSHVLSSPEAPDKTRHLACEFALATRLILEEQALDRNESTGKNGRYARKFHPRSQINGNNEFEDKSRSRRPLTAGELAVNWREFIRSTLIVRYSTFKGTTTDGKPVRQEPMKALEEAIEKYLSGNTTKSESSPVEIRIAKSLPLFPQTKFALRNSSTKLVVRISHRFDNDIVARSLNKQLQLLPHERIAKTYKPENAIRRLFLNEDKNIVLLLRPDYRYELFSGIETNRSSQRVLGGSADSKSNDVATDEEKCLKDIIKFTNKCDDHKSQSIRRKKQGQEIKEQKRTAPSIVWVDSSWHRLQGLAPIFGDEIPAGGNGKKNTARCSMPREIVSSNDQEDTKPPNVWLSLWLAEWPVIDTAGSNTSKKRLAPSSENHEAAMVYPWTDSLAWNDAENILLPSNWGSSDTAFQ